MKCYSHAIADAVGICKCCCKGVCSECAIDVGNGLACRGHCEDIVRSYNHVLEQSLRAATLTSENIRGQRRGLIVLGVFATAAGALFITLGFTVPYGLARFGISGLGVLVSVIGVWLIVGEFAPHRIDIVTQSPDGNSKNDNTQ